MLRIPKHPGACIDPQDHMGSWFCRDRAQCLKRLSKGNLSTTCYSQDAENTHVAPICEYADDCSFAKLIQPGPLAQWLAKCPLAIYGDRSSRDAHGLPWSACGGYREVSLLHTADEHLKLLMHHHLGPVNRDKMGIRGPRSCIQLALIDFTKPGFVVANRTLPTPFCEIFVNPSNDGFAWCPDRTCVIVTQILHLTDTAVITVCPEPQLPLLAEPSELPFFEYEGPPVVWSPAGTCLPSEHCAARSMTSYLTGTIFKQSVFSSAARSQGLSCMSSISQSALPSMNVLQASAPMSHALHSGGGLWNGQDI